MKLKSPLIEYVIAQKFGDNDNNSYAMSGLKGHPGVDLVPPIYGATVSHSCDGLCYTVLNKNNPNLMAFRAVYDLVDGGDGFTYEICYGHLRNIFTTPPVSCVIGQPLGEEGNTGPVYKAGVLVTEAEKESGSTAGHHVHFQVRKCLKTDIVNPDRHYLSMYGGEPVDYETGGYYRDKDNYVYEVVDFENGFNGCIDPLQFLEDTSVVVIPETPQEIQVQLTIWQRLLDWFEKVVLNK